MGNPIQQLLENSPALKVATKPLTDMLEDANHILRKEQAVRSWIHLIITFSIFVTGVIISCIGAPTFTFWLGNIVTSIGVPEALNPICVAYLAGWILAYPASFLCKQIIRGLCLCFYNDADYVHTFKDCEAAAKKLTKYADEPVTGEEIQALLDFCVERIHEPNKQHNPEWYIGCRRKILHGELEQYYDLKDALQKETRSLQAQKKHLEITEQYYKEQSFIRRHRRTSCAKPLVNLLESSILTDSSRPADSIKTEAMISTDQTFSPSAIKLMPIEEVSLGTRPQNSVATSPRDAHQPIDVSTEMLSKERRIAEDAARKWRQHIAKIRENKILRQKLTLDNTKPPIIVSLPATNTEHLTNNALIEITDTMHNKKPKPDYDSENDSDDMQELYTLINKHKRAVNQSLSTVNKATVSSSRMLR